jgi:YVTN family beta-propeller protein
MGPCNSVRLKISTAVVALAISLNGSGLTIADQHPLTLEAKIPLGRVQGRLDHLAIDRTRRLLFVAELGSNSVAVVDLAAQKVLHRIKGLSEPQGVAYVPLAHSIFVANGGDGSIRIFSGNEFSPVGHVDLGSDADNLRVITAKSLVLAGFGSGGIALIDANSPEELVIIRLKAHPEGFEAEPSGTKVFVNVPDAREIAVLDLESKAQVGSWKFPDLGANFPMALGEKPPELLTVFRRPPRLAVIDARLGKTRSTIQTCGDADDIFIDAKRDRAYVSCGAGFIDVFQLHDGDITRIAQIPTALGARTALYDSELDRLFLAVRASAATPASIWVYRP